MKSPSLSSSSSFAGSGNVITRLMKNTVMRQLVGLQRGYLVVSCDGQRYEFGQSGATPAGEVTITSPQFWSLVATRGSIGAGEAYIHGYWHSSELTKVVQVLAANLDALDALEGGLATVARPFLQTLHWLNRNTRNGSRRNISAHYDLGNGLFEHMLDPTMMYSAALFSNPEDTLEQAQLRKLERICQKLDLQPEDHLLEIGTGWGSMALYAASHFGCRVTTTTLSKEQFAYTQSRIRELGLEAKVTLLLEDYRDLTGTYDKLVSIEMVEAVGHEHLSTYFAQCSQLLKDDGLMLLQSITIRDQRYEQARHSVDFIQRYIFPGGALPSVTKLMEVICQETDMTLHHMEEMGRSYARTLKLWHNNLQEHRDALTALGYDETFFRLWEFYLCYCEGGFLEHTIGTSQLLLAKPQARQETFGLSA